jgi:hypothetical protein
MSALLARFATPLTTGLFLASLISGIALFFHVGTASFHEMHEWMSMVLSLAASLVAGFAFAWPSITGSAGGTGGNPAFAMVNVVAGGTPGQVAPLLGKTEAEVVDALKQTGFTAADCAKPLTEIATASGKDTMALMATLAALKAK